MKSSTLPSVFTCKALSPATWDDYQALFESRGGPKNCWCMVWRNASPQPESLSAKDHKKACMKERVFSGTPNGLIGYLEGVPVAWCSVAPKSTFRNLTKDSGTDPVGVWSVTCFFVRTTDRGKGLQQLLLREAMDFAKSQGATVLEAYPVEKDSPSYRFMGFVPLFEEAGFSCLGSEGIRRKRYRIELASGEGLGTMEPHDERPDIFGPCYPGMERLHQGVLDFIKAAPGTKTSTVMLPLQCTFGEYVGEHHDSTYDWMQFCFGADPDRCFAVGVNRFRQFAQDGLRGALLSRITAAWQQAGFEPPTPMHTVNGVEDLKKAPWEMVLSLHFYFQRTDGDGEAEDTQYGKIVYTHSSLTENLEKIRLLGKNP